LAAQGVVLRGETAADRPVLDALYVADRWHELAHTAWTDSAKAALLADQAGLQRRHYAACYPEADCLVLERDGAAVGRLCLDRGPADWRVVDMVLAPAARGRGYGTAVLRAICRHAAAKGATVSLHVVDGSPALRLYRRLGFRETGEDGLHWAMEWRGGAGDAGAAMDSLGDR
jgi:ribosomal protein S18 acetylase RimI-like enzyme